jgi:hypothetical protein
MKPRTLFAPIVKNAAKSPAQSFYLLLMENPSTSCINDLSTSTAFRNSLELKKIEQRRARRRMYSMIAYRAMLAIDVIWRTKEHNRLAIDNLSVEIRPCAF